MIKFFFFFVLLTLSFFNLSEPEVSWPLKIKIKMNKEIRHENFKGQQSKAFFSH